MRIPAVVCNVVLFAFTCFVLLTDGMSAGVPYLTLTLLLLLVPILSAVVLLRGMMPPGQKAHCDPSSGSPLARRGTAFCNLVLIGFSGWAIVDQYPHPEEGGVIPYAVLVLFTPVITLLALFGSRQGKLPEAQGMVAQRR